MPKLVVISQGLSGGQSHVLSAELTTIGRAEGNNFQIADASISGRHCEVKLFGDDLIIRDLNSTNGTFIAGRKIHEGTLRLGQVIRLGQVELRFQVSIPSETSIPARPTTTSLALVKPRSGSVPASLRSSMVQTSSDTTLVPRTGSLSSSPPLPLPRRHQVLFIDDNTAFLETVTHLFSILANNTWDIQCAASPEQAMAALQGSTIDLIVLDVGMPRLDGTQLLDLIHRRYPTTKKAILTGYASDYIRSTCLAAGAELVLEKPRSADHLETAFNALNELIAAPPPQEGFTGTLRQVGLQEIIQMECLRRNSSILEIRNQQVQGEIYIKDGVIVHAMAGTLMGEKAFNKLLSLSAGEFHTHPFQPPIERTIHGAWEALVMEAARVRDETAVLLLEDTVTASSSPSTPAIAPVLPAETSTAASR